LLARLSTSFTFIKEMNLLGFLALCGCGQSSSGKISLPGGGGSELAEGQRSFSVKLRASRKREAKERKEAGERIEARKGLAGRFV
jgi:hypothetical protein